MIEQSSSNKQVLDRLPVERQRGITVKAQTATMFHQHHSTTYMLNLIDTPVSACFYGNRYGTWTDTDLTVVMATMVFHVPSSLQGHVDFSYEVSRSLAACQGVVLLVDAQQAS